MQYQTIIKIFKGKAKIIRLSLSQLETRNWKVKDEDKTPDEQNVDNC